MNLESALSLGSSWWRKLGMTLVRKIKVLTKSGKGVDGRFKAYTGEYAKHKADGGFKRQSSTSTKPDLQLTGDMLRDLKVKGDINANGVAIGWTVWGQRMIHNAEQGRAISTAEKPLEAGIEAYAIREYNKRVNALLTRAQKSTTVPLNIL
jgi:hypothetical protein